ncbi:DUF4143 domain-containing protein [Nocardia lasii]|uniref:DUF4143 domain-containing protein n=1 Tax=Nocardia lasii TaxID=1616107 RepID=A0ABW1JWD5_9NOCA
MGALVETFVFAELLKLKSLTCDAFEIMHYRDRDGREIDFILETPDGSATNSATASPPESSFTWEPKGSPTGTESCRCRCRLSGVMRRCARNLPMPDRPDRDQHTSAGWLAASGHGHRFGGTSTVDPAPGRMTICRADQSSVRSTRTGQVMPGAFANRVSVVSNSQP